MIQALKRARKESRDREIELYGHPINFAKTFRNRKIYSRKNLRIDLSSFYAFLRNALFKRTSCG